MTISSRFSSENSVWQPRTQSPVRPVDVDMGNYGLIVYPKNGINNNATSKSYIYIYFKISPGAIRLIHRPPDRIDLS